MRSMSVSTLMSIALSMPPEMPYLQTITRQSAPHPRHGRSQAKKRMLARQQHCGHQKGLRLRCR